MGAQARCFHPLSAPLQVAAHIAANRGVYEGFVVGPLDAYIERMFRDGEWGDNLTLHAVADMRSITVQVIAGDDVVVIYPREARPRGTVMLAFVAEAHYDAVVTDPAGEEFPPLPHAPPLLPIAGKRRPAPVAELPPPSPEAPPAPPQRRKRKPAVELAPVAEPPPPSPEAPPAPPQARKRKVAAEPLPPFAPELLIEQELAAQAPPTTVMDSD